MFRIGSLIFILLITNACVQAGIIKDIFKKVTNTGNKTDNEPVRQSVPVCGSGLLFASADQQALSPEMIFITSRNSRITNQPQDRSKRVNEIAAEYRFNVDNVTIEDLEHYGFNRDAPVTILMHGFTSGYPLQAWMTGIVEAYTIEREVKELQNSNSNYENFGSSSGSNSGYSSSNNHSTRRPHKKRDRRHHSNSTISSRRRDDDYLSSGYSGGNNNGYSDVNGNNGYTHGHDDHHNYNNGYGENNQNGAYNKDHNDNNQHNQKNNHNSHGNSHHGGSSGHQASSGGHHSAAQKVNHNLFILNWNYAAKGILYPRAVANIPIVASYGARFVNEKLLQAARIDPRRIQLIGHSLGAHLAGFIGKNTQSKIGRIYGLDPAGPCFGAYTGFLYPKAQRLAPSDALEVITIQTNSALLGHDKPLGRYSIYVEGGEIQPGCKGGGILKSLGTLTWDGGDFDTIACSHSRAPNLLMYNHQNKISSSKSSQCEMVAYECSSWEDFRRGVCGICSHGNNNHDNFDDRRRQSSRDPNTAVACVRIGLDWVYTGTKNPNQLSSITRGNNHSQSRPSRLTQSSGYDGSSNHSESGRRPRNKREDENRGFDGNVKPISMYMRTSDTQPYCTFHYQIVLELNEPFRSRDPPMSLLLQDSEAHSGGSSRSSLSTDEFGHRQTDLIYTQLLTSVNRIGRIEHATLLFRNGHKGGIKTLKSLQINYMSNIDPEIRKRLSIRLCPVEKDESQAGKQSTIENTRFFFEPCNSVQSMASNGHGSGHGAGNEYNSGDGHNSGGVNEGDYLSPRDESNRRPNNNYRPKFG